MCIEYHIYVNMYHVSAQGVDERMLNVLLISCTGTRCEPPTPKTLNRLAENETVACPGGERKEGDRTLCPRGRSRHKTTLTAGLQWFR